MRLRNRILFTIFASAFLALFALAPVARADVITDWNEETLNTARNRSLGTATAGRLYALVNIAMYDAVNGIDVADGASPRDSALVRPTFIPTGGSPVASPPGADRRAAAAAAAHRVLSLEQPSRSGFYDARLSVDLAAFGVGATDPAVTWGAAVGEQVVELRTDDAPAVDGEDPQAGGTGVGKFTTDFGSSRFRNMKPFGIVDKRPYRGEGPPPLTSAEYAAAFNEVKTRGDKRISDLNLDPEGDEIFRFWKGGGGSERPPGLWISIARVVVLDSQHGVDNDADEDSLSRTARLFALLGIALGDSVITTWDDKFEYQFWRPKTAINNADLDGNGDTDVDPDWQPRNSSKGGSPEYTSGQATFAGTASTILAHFFGDRESFSFKGTNEAFAPRNYDSFSEAAAEAAEARIIAGIHFRFSLEEGLAFGQAVAEEVLARRLLPRDERGDNDGDENDDDDDDDDD